jgi:hypothetical protein
MVIDGDNYKFAEIADNINMNRLVNGQYRQKIDP